MSRHRLILDWGTGDELASPGYSLECIEPATCPKVLATEDPNGPTTDECWHQHMLDAVGSEQFSMAGNVGFLVEITMPSFPDEDSVMTVLPVPGQ